MWIIWLMVAAAVGWLAAIQFLKMRTQSASRRPEVSPPNYDPGALPWKQAATKRVLAVPVALEIGYRDKKGNDTRRTVRVLYFEAIPGHPEVRFQAIDDGAAHSQTFYSSRVRSCFNAVTHEHVADLGAYLRKLP